MPDPTVPPVTAPPVGDAPAIPPVTEPTALTQGVTPSESWLDSVPEAHRESLKGYESFDAVVKALTPPVVPDEYAIPEGVEGIDAEVFKGFQPLAKELGLTQEAMDKLIKFDIDRATKLPEQIMKMSADKLRDENVALATSMGQEKYNVMVEDARLAMRSFADPDVVAWLDQTGQGNNPILLKMLAKVGAAMKEESPKGGTGGGGEKKDASELFYPTMK